MSVICFARLFNWSDFCFDRLRRIGHPISNQWESIEKAYGEKQKIKLCGNDSSSNLIQFTVAFHCVIRRIKQSTPWCWDITSFLAICFILTDTFSWRTMGWNSFYHFLVSRLLRAVNPSSTLIKERRHLSTEYCDTSPQPGCVTAKKVRIKMQHQNSEVRINSA
jgi:hypothetical protein